MTSGEKRDLAAAWREIAVIAMKRANELDPPSVRAVCDRCGEETRVPDDLGRRCKSHRMIAGAFGRCCGTYGPSLIQAEAALAAASVLPLPDNSGNCQCDECGHIIGGSGPEFIGLECRTVGWGSSGKAKFCPGHYRAKIATAIIPDKPIGPRPAGLREPVIEAGPFCACDACGLRVHAQHDGDKCMAHKQATYGIGHFDLVCPGTFRLKPEPTVTIHDGDNTIEVPESTLASHAAVQTFGEEQDGEWHYPELEVQDIASTYRGGSGG